MSATVRAGRIEKISGDASPRAGLARHRFGLAAARESLRRLAA